MAKSNLLDTSTVTLSDVIGNGKIYRVPIYQRDYSWKDEHWEDLWNDILNILQFDEQRHYMGSIVVKSEGNKTFSIIDGQQRLATLSLIALATIKNIQDLIDAGQQVSENKERKELLMNKFLGYKDAASLRYSSKLFLNENNDGFYQSHLLQFRPPINPHRLNDSEKLMWKAFEFFYNKIKFYYQSNYKGEYLAGFLNDYVAEKLMFIQIIVEDDISAYTVFETLNARGEGLTVTDLLKNYLFSIAGISNNDLNHIKLQWNKIIQIIDLDHFPTFLRHYWNSRNTLVRLESLFKTVKRSIVSQNDVFALLDDLEKCASVYSALNDATDDLWITNKTIQRRIQELSLFKVKQCYPLLIVAYEKFQEDEFAKVLKICSVITFRYQVIGGLNPNTMEAVYNKVAQKVFSEEVTQAKEVFNDLKEVYPNDEDFKNYFSTKSINSKRSKSIVRYILINIENQIVSSERSFNDEGVTIEHILPENPVLQWNEYFPDEVQQNFIYRLGNYTLLEAPKNKNCQNKIYKEKLKIYRTSQYQMTNQISFNEWTRQSIKERQLKLANYAACIWRIDY
jgi:uncharacterized protein with ParB-like and HNH nuclease domain